MMLNKKEIIGLTPYKAQPLNYNGGKLYKDGFQEISGPQNPERFLSFLTRYWDLKEPLVLRDTRHFAGLLSWFPAEAVAKFSSHYHFSKRAPEN